MIKIEMTVASSEEAKAVEELYEKFKPHVETLDDQDVTVTLIGQGDVLDLKVENLSNLIFKDVDVIATDSGLEFTVEDQTFRVYEL
jgi:frataxin-like iron-binding protein CyaY